MGDSFISGGSGLFIVLYRMMPGAGQLCVWKWIVIISCPTPAQHSQAVGIEFLHRPAVNDRYMEGRGEGRREKGGTKNAHKFSSS